MKALGWGSLLMVIVLAYSAFSGNWNLVIEACGGIGFGLLLLAGILSGGLTSGSQYRANTATETNRDRRSRQDVSLGMILVGLPNIAAAVLAYFLMS